MENPIWTARYRARIEAALKDPQLEPIVRTVLEEVAKNRAARNTLSFITMWKQAHDELVDRGYDLPALDEGPTP